MDGWMDGWMDEWVDRCFGFQFKTREFLIRHAVNVRILLLYSLYVHIQDLIGQENPC